MEPVQITVIAGFILGITQLITQNFPKWNKMNVTLIVTAVVGIIAIAMPVSVTYFTVFAALAAEVLGYNLFTKSVIPTINYFRGKGK
jgi:hypothetical protein